MRRCRSQITCRCRRLGFPHRRDRACADYLPGADGEEAALRREDYRQRVADLREDTRGLWPE